MVDDVVYVIFELENGVVVQMNSFWCVCVCWDDLVMFQVDGIFGLVVVGFMDCYMQLCVNMLKLVWNLDLCNIYDFL